MLSREEYEKWYKKIPANECTFCNWQKYQIVLKEFDNWIWIACNAPYWRYHTMILPKRHFVKYSDMSFSVSRNLTEGILLCPDDSIFEIKFPAIDIKGSTI